MMSADTLASYGSLARFKDVQRLKPVGDYTVVGAGGDMSDFQYLEKTLEAAMYVSTLLLSLPSLPLAPWEKNRGIEWKDGYQASM